MKTFSKISVAILAITFMFGLAGATRAATAPSLGTASTFSVLAGPNMAGNGAGITVSGDIGLSTGLVAARTGIWVVGGNQYFSAAPATTAMNDAILTAGTSAYNVLVNQASDGMFTLGPVFAPAPGVWTAAGNPTFSGTLTLTGSATDVWVFQLSTDFTFTGTVILGGAAQACNVFWQIGGATGASGTGDATINIGPTDVFVGTLIAGRDVSIVGGGTVNGRILAARSFTADGGQTVSGPTCSPVPALPDTGSSGANFGTVNVVKVVINDNGGTKTVADFPLFVNGILVTSGQTNNFPAPAGEYTVTETSDSNYVRTFSGDCNSSGKFNLNKGNSVFCIVTNNDIGAPVVPVVPPLIDLVKVASPLSLPLGPGLVQYTYTLRNIGTVPVTDITMVGDTCSPIVLVSGDTNGDSKLDLNEVWVHTCSTTLTETHTNTVVATGWANGISAVDIASANVVVGLSIVPPLIHVTKIPSPLALPAGGGTVTYTNKVTNPGTVALSQVSLSDDQCGTANYFSGDTNSDSKLDPTETWVFTCVQNLTQTTVNTVVATGQANGLTARDMAVNVVVVAAVIPKLPNTGAAPTNMTIALLAAMLGLVSISLAVVLRKRLV